MSVLETLRNPFSHLLLQLIVIIFASQVLGTVLQKLKQPLVIGEVLAGILLGPSFFGSIFPAPFRFLFNSESLGTLQIISQLGLIFFMFVVGLHTQPTALRKSGKRAIFISSASIIIPFVLGVLLSHFMYDSFALSGASTLAFSLFLGISVSVTAFPVLARIIHDCNLNSSQIAQLSLTCAAINDISAWTILAAIVGICKNNGMSSLAWTAGLTAVGIIFFLNIMRPFLTRIIESEKFSEKQQFIAGLLVLFFGSIYFEWSGVHALFGGFLAGVSMPKKTKYREMLQNRLESLGSLILLPAFFAITGLRTQINLLGSLSSWVVCLGIIAIAVLGKWGGTTLASRLSGLSWKDSVFLGVLMNTRGLIELVVLNVGLELKIISPTLFTMMVIMALVTTAMTGPCLSVFPSD